MKTRTILIVGGAVAAYFFAKSAGYDLLCSCTYGKLWDAVQGKPASGGCGCGGALAGVSGTATVNAGPITAPSQLQPIASSFHTGSVL